MKRTECSDFLNYGNRCKFAYNVLILCSFFIATAQASYRSTSSFTFSGVNIIGNLGKDERIRRNEAISRISNHPFHLDIPHKFSLSPHINWNADRCRTTMLHERGIDNSETLSQTLPTLTKEMHVSTEHKKSMSSLSTVANIGFLSLIAVNVLVYSGVLAYVSKDAIQYTNDLILRDDLATLFITIVTGTFVKGVTEIAKRGYLESRDSRKLIHTLSAPLFMLCWPLFSNLNSARYFAAIVPFLNGVRLYIAGSAEKNDGEKESELVNAISRSGDAKEVLEGPFIYVIILLISVLGFWHDNLIGVVALSVMAAGDGAAEIVGRRLGSNNKWFFNRDKSIAGTIAFFVASLVASTGISLWLNFTGNLMLPTLNTADLIGRLSIICGLSALVELLPIGDDNWNVPLFAGIMSAVLFQYI